jgi:branched-chain amino acid transport system ATP-binding protein
MTGFEKPDSGNVEIDGTSIVTLKPFQIARLGVSRTFQDVRLFWDLSVMDNVICARQGGSIEGLIRNLFGFGLKGDERRNRSNAEWALEFVKLGSFGNAAPQELSYGQQKLLSIVCAFETEARILVLDEPVSGVDLQMRRELLRLLVDLKSYRRMILFIEHDIDAVREIADLAIVMDHGSVIAEGQPQDVLARREVITAFWGK